MAKRRSANYYYNYPSYPQVSKEVPPEPTQLHDVGDFPAFIGEEPPAEYQYDPRQTFDPEAVGPVPPSYGEKGGNYLLVDEQNPTPAYLPTTPAGVTRYPEGPEYGPEPPTFHATNVPETARKWGGAGPGLYFPGREPRSHEDRGGN